MNKHYYQRHIEDQRRLKRQIYRCCGTLKYANLHYGSAYFDEKRQIYKPIYKDNYYRYLKRYANRKVRRSTSDICMRKGRKFKKIFDVAWEYW